MNTNTKKQYVRDYILENLERRLGKYAYALNESFVFKVAKEDTEKSDINNAWIVVMKKLDDTKTNENSIRIFRMSLSRCETLFMGDKFKVIRITNIINPSKNKKTIIDCNTKIKYEVGEMPIFLDEKTEKKLFYFKSLFRAYYDRIMPTNHTGEWREWFNNGKLARVCGYVDGKKTGDMTEWYDSEYHDDIKIMGSYDNDLKTGKWTKYYEASEFKRLTTKKEEGLYLNDKKVGHWIEFWENGNVFLTTNYKNGNIVSPAIYLNDDGTKCQEYYYNDNDGYRIEKIIKWNKNGDVEEIF